VEPCRRSEEREEVKPRLTAEGEGVQEDLQFQILVTFHQGRYQQNRYQNCRPLLWIVATCRYPAKLIAENGGYSNKIVRLGVAVGSQLERAA